MLNYLKKIFSIFLIFNLTFVSSAQAAATFNDINGDGTGFDVSDQETFPTGIAFNNDGTKMFIVGNSGDDVNEYILSTPFDVSTSTFRDINGDGTGFDVSDQDTFPIGIAFNNDGTKMFVLGNSGDDVNEYILSTPFDVSTSTFRDINGDGTGFDISSQDAVPLGLKFNNDGTKMFIVGNTGDDVNEYTLTTSFDVKSARFVDRFSVNSEDITPIGIAFNNDGTKMFVLGHAGVDINEYTLSTGFDIKSTVSFVDSFDISSQETIPRDLVFNNDGTKMFVVGNDGDDVNEYTLSCPFKVTASSKCDAPPKIKDVRGIVDAQINTAKNFAKDSSQSAFKRLDILRANKYQNTSAQNIELLFQNDLFKKVSNSVVSPIQANLNPLRSLDQILPDDWEAWSEGSISFGKIGETSLSSAQDIDSLGITVGADKKIDNDQILGVALRVGHTDVDVGTFGSAVDTNALSLSVYGSNSLDDSKFLEHVFGVSYLDSDIIRKNQGNTSTQTGDREGKQVFGSLNFAREYEDGDVIITPTGRIDGSYTALNSYTESGTNAISYNDQDIKSLMASLGVLIDQDTDWENSNVKSRFNLEYGKEFASNSKVVTSYVSDNENFEYQADNKNRDIYTAGLGFDFKHDQGLTISTDYEKQKISGFGFINKFTLSAGFLSRKETEFVLGFDEDMNSNFKISKALDSFDLVFDLENDFSNQENHNANLSLSSKF
ncbi:autotransporter domain-containing protein [Candidatus Pelagibacter sp.]|nr:autotransporter domain-containing protein [Candidatus Pelagibacter sp.]